jgi:3-oxoacyl-[acyl-carrier protein] reductase
MLAMDVDDDGSVERGVGSVLAQAGRIDAVVNNAGIGGPWVPVEQLESSDWHRVLATNLDSIFYTTKHCVAELRARRGAIVNIASIEAQNPATLHAHYNAAKAGVVMHTRTTAAELGRHGIRVNSVSPGLIDRDGLAGAWPEGVARYLASAPLGRLGQPADIADACLFLASPAARWITGADLVVDGGVLTSSVY